VRLLIADGNNLVEESVFEGTNSGPLQGPDGTQIPATGLRASVPFSGIHTVQGDKIASTRLYFDQVDMLTQLRLTSG
jgi:predicted ester cyclase